MNHRFMLSRVINKIGIISCIENIEYRATVIYVLQDILIYIYVKKYNQTETHVFKI